MIFSHIIGMQVFHLLVGKSVALLLSDSDVGSELVLSPHSGLHAGRLRGVNHITPGSGTDRVGVRVRRA